MLILLNSRGDAKVQQWAERETLPFQGYDCISVVKDGVSFSVTETIHPGVMALVQFSALGEMVLDLHI